MLRSLQFLIFFPYWACSFNGKTLVSKTKVPRSSRGGPAKKDRALLSLKVRDSPSRIEVSEVLFNGCCFDNDLFASVFFCGNTVIFSLSISVCFYLRA